jgi:hypothetical protein
MDPILLSSLLASVGGPEEFCVSSESKSRLLLARLKDVYNYFQEGAEQPFGPLEELLVDDMDLESIWQELQTWNRPMIRSLKKRVRRLHRNSSSSSSKEHGDDDADADADFVEDEGDDEEMAASVDEEEPELSSSGSERDAESSWDGEEEDEEEEFANGHDDYDDEISEDESKLKKTKTTKKKSRVSNKGVTLVFSSVTYSLL